MCGCERDGPIAGTVRWTRTFSVPKFRVPGRKRDNSQRNDVIRFPGMSSRAVSVPSIIPTWQQITHVFFGSVLSLVYILDGALSPRERSARRSRERGRFLTLKDDPISYQSLSRSEASRIVPSSLFRRALPGSNDLRFPGQPRGRANEVASFDF